MGGTLPVCPFCRKLCANGGIKDHVKAKHPDRYPSWILSGQKPYWMYNDHGILLEAYIDDK